MKKIEYILSEYGFVFKIVLYIVWFLWALQLSGSTIIKAFSEETPKASIEEIGEFRQFIQKKIKIAQTEGPSYTPQRYFEDLKEIEERERSANLPYYANDRMQLMKVCMDNAQKGHYRWRDMHEYASLHPDRCKSSISRDTSFRLAKAFLWFITLYQRTVFLVVFLYLIRMVDRRGILETVLADKKKFILAVLVWPYFLYKYPYNVVREIRVEAELRRLKGLFRVFSAKESRLVREIANSSYYKQWIAEFHQQDRSNFQRGLFVAIVATLFLHLLFSSNLRASEKRVRSPGLIVIAAGDRIETSQNLTEDAPEDD